MASNDLLLLDSLVRKNKSIYGTLKDDPEYFELFSIDSVLKNYDLNLDELFEGWVDGTDDGGIDGFFVFIDGILLSEEFEPKYVRHDAQIEVHIFTVKSAATFKQAPLNSLISSVADLFNLINTNDNLTNPFSDAIINLRERFRENYVELADKNPQISFKIHYCTRGDTKHLNANLTQKGTQLCKIIQSMFGRCRAEVFYLGATELLHFAQKQKRYSLKLPFSESPISRDGKNYILLCPVREYLKFITDEDSNLRRYLFDGNVRDYLGEVSVNNDISATLLDHASHIDFWWLNNGVTILASNAMIVGKTLSIENVQIVNGLQTTETIFRSVNELDMQNDERTILVKVIISTDDIVRARIIKATNYQNSVSLASLRSVDQFQRNIEQYLSDHGWFYERRSNMYRNLGKPGDRIVSIQQLGAAVRTFIFHTPSTAERRQKWLRNDNSYNQVFNSTWPLDLYLACVQLYKIVEKQIRGLGSAARINKKQVNYWSHLVALLIVYARMKSTSYDVHAFAEHFKNFATDDTETQNAIDHILEVISRLDEKLFFMVHFSKKLEVAAIKELADNNFSFLPLSVDAQKMITSRTVARSQKREKAQQELEHG